MDPLQSAYLERARTAIGLAIGDFTGPTANPEATAFREIAKSLLLSGHSENAENLLRNHKNPLVSKAAAQGLDTWGPDFATLAAAYVASIAQGSALDQILRYAGTIPDHVSNIMVASGFTAGTVAEGGPKLTRSLGLEAVQVEPWKVAAITVLTQELARAAGGSKLFEEELRKAVQRGTNQAVLSAINSGTTINVASTGDALADLRAGLRAAPPSEGYVVIASTADVADLATRVENRGGMNVRGGTFVPGIEVVAVDDTDEMTIIPASLLAVRDWGLRIDTAGHASIDLRDNAQSPYQLTSLFQTNSLGVRCERLFSIALSDAASVVVGGS